MTPGASLVVQMVKNLPAMQETWVRSLGWEDPLEKDMATYSSILGESHGQGSLAGYSPWFAKSRTTKAVQIVTTVRKLKDTYALVGKL